ncbi:MAG TPA: hypothetical protein VG518_01780 [Solirubrobacterales bacterium]|nr:hypothetical protein [Solirubrobacterales bacterium]
MGAGLIGIALLFFASDLLELAMGGLSGGQLLIQLLALLVFVPVVLALYASQRSRLDSLGEAGALLLAASSVLLAFVSSYGLASEATGFTQLVGSIPVVFAFAAVSAVAGASLFSYAAYRAELLAGWTVAILVGGFVVGEAGHFFPGPAWAIGSLAWETGLLAIGFRLLFPAGPAEAEGLEREDL